MVTAIIFIIVLSVLIFVHELGHFVIAKRSGMRVDEFGFGFPPRIWAKRKGETEYSINWIPFGGFVKIYGEDGDDRAEPRSFGSKSFSARLTVIVAGVAMNLLLAAVLLMGSNFSGMRVEVGETVADQDVRDKKIQIIQVAPDSPAAVAGLGLLDEIIGFRSADGNEFTPTTVKSVQEFIGQHAGQKISMSIRRGAETLDKELEVRKNPPIGQGPVGIGLTLTGVVSYPWYEAVWRGVYDAYLMTRNTAYGYGLLLKELLTHGKLIADVSGPIGIAKLTGQAAQFGFSFLMQFVAMISVNLAILNIVPFPALDGGRAFLLIVEKIRGVPIKRRTEAFINTIGFFVLLALMVLVTTKDIMRLF